MRIEIIWPKGWSATQTEASSFQVVIPPVVSTLSVTPVQGGDSHQAAPLCLRIRDGLPSPIDKVAFIEEAMLLQAPADCVLKRLSLQRIATLHGWPAQSAHYALFTPQGELIEERLGVFYRLLNHCSEVMLRIRDRAEYLQRAAELESLMLSGRAVWDFDDKSTLWHLTGAAKSAGG
jgi:hypothetical protein